MGKLFLLFFLVVFHFIDCRTIIDGSNLHSLGIKPQPQTVYVTKESFPVQEANKQIPVYVSLNPVSSYRVSQQFPAETGFQNHFVQAPNNPYLHGVVPYSNQYTLNSPNLYLPYNNFGISSDINTDFTKSIHTTLPQVNTGTKIGTVKSTPIFQHQIYHPLHTNTEYKQLPSPPKIYRNFHPIIPQKQQIQNPEPKSEKPVSESEEKEEINNEEDEENEKLEEEVDHEEQQDDEQEYFKPGNFFTRNSESYRDHEAEDEDDDRYSSSKISSKYKYPKDQKKYKNKQVSAFSDSDFDSFRGFKDPKVEIKMYKYSKSMKKPERKEFLEGKESRNVPIIQHSQKSYKEQWIISKSSSVNNE